MTVFPPNSLDLAAILSGGGGGGWLIIDFKKKKSYPKSKLLMLWSIEYQFGDTKMFKNYSDDLFL